ncbi:hypothetical protein CBL_05964 [Carabus blaptoides fortunei]
MAHYELQDTKKEKSFGNVAAGCGESQSDMAAAAHGNYTHKSLLMTRIKKVRRRATESFMVNIGFKICMTTDSALWEITVYPFIVSVVVGRDFDASTSRDQVPKCILGHA